MKTKEEMKEVWDEVKTTGVEGKAIKTLDFSKNFLTEDLLNYALFECIEEESLVSLSELYLVR
jgi:hypothetical protein